MATSQEAPKLSKRRKLGKGKKKAWRAADIKDIEEFIDDERRQLQSGGVVSERSDDKLFFVDKAKSQRNKLPAKRIPKENRKNRQLKSTALLRPDDCIKSVIAPLKANYKKGRNTQKILDRLAEKVRSKVRLEAVEQTKEYVEAKRKARRKRNEIPTETQDIWNADGEEKGPAVKRPKKMMGKPSKIMATSIPHPGASANPSYEDHQDLLQEAFDAEDKVQKRQNAVTNSFKRTDKENVATEESRLAEMSAGLIPDSDSENEPEEPQGEEVAPSVAMPRRKSKRQKQAEAKLREQLRNKKAKALQNQRETMVERVRLLKAEIRKDEEKTNKKIEVKRKVREEAPYQTKRLGKTKFEEPQAAFKLSNELVPSLRQLKPEGHVLEDVFKSIQRRNIVVPSMRQKKPRKHKTKAYIKRSHSQVK